MVPIIYKPVQINGLVSKMIETSVMKEFKYFSKRSCKCLHHLLISFAVDFPNITLPEWSSRPSRSPLRKVYILVILPVSERLSVLNLATTIFFSKKSSKYHLAIFLMGKLSVKIRSQTTLWLAASMWP